MKDIERQILVIKECSRAIWSSFPLKKLACRIKITVIVIFIFCFHFFHCIVCPVIFSSHELSPLSFGVFTYISFIGIIFITIHNCYGSQYMKSIGYFPDFVADTVGKDQSAVFLILCCGVIYRLDNKPRHWEIINMI